MDNSAEYVSASQKWTMAVIPSRVVSKDSRKKKSPTKSSTLYGKRNKYKALGQGQMAWLISYRSVRRKIRRWGQGDQRKKHVDRLMGVAMKYEDFCMTC